MIVMVLKCYALVVLNGFTQLETASIFFSDTRYLSHCDIWGIFFPTKEINKKQRGGDSSKAEHICECKRAQRDPENCKTRQIGGNHY